MELDTACNKNEITVKQRNKQWNEYSPKRYCKKCHKRGHNGKDCKSNKKKYKCGICNGSHESIKCAKCPVIRKLIKLYQKAVTMMDDGATIDNIKKMENYEILNYISGDNQKYHQHLSQTLDPSSIDRGGGNTNSNDEKEEKKNDMNNDDIMMQNDHDNSATISSIPTLQPTQPTQDKSALLSLQGGTVHEIDKNYDENDDDTVLKGDTMGAPPKKRHKGSTI